MRPILFCLLVTASCFGQLTDEELQSLQENHAVQAESKPTRPVTPTAATQAVEVDPVLSNYKRSQDYQDLLGYIPGRSDAEAFVTGISSFGTYIKDDIAYSALQVQIGVAFLPNFTPLAAALVIYAGTAKTLEEAQNLCKRIPPEGNFHVPTFPELATIVFAQKRLQKMLPYSTYPDIPDNALDFSEAWIAEEGPNTSVSIPTNFHDSLTLEHTFNLETKMQEMREQLSVATIQAEKATLEEQLKKLEGLRTREREQENIMNRLGYKLEIEKKKYFNGTNISRVQKQFKAAVDLLAATRLALSSFQDTIKYLSVGDLFGSIETANTKLKTYINAGIPVLCQSNFKTLKTSTSSN